MDDVLPDAAFGMGPPRDDGTIFAFGRYFGCRFARVSPDGGLHLTRKPALLTRVVMQAMAAAETLLGLSAKADDLMLAQVAVRAFLVYGALIVFVRLGKKRFLSQATPLDAILLILIGSIASRGVSGTAPFFTSILACGWLIALHSVFSFISCRSDRFSHWIKGNPTILVRDGRIDREAMLNTHMSEGDLDEDLRKKGLRDAAQIAEARLERDGTLSVLKA